MKVGGFIRMAGSEQRERRDKKAIHPPTSIPLFFILMPSPSFHGLQVVQDGNEGMPSLSLVYP